MIRSSWFAAEYWFYFQNRILVTSTTLQPKQGHAGFWVALAASFVGQGGQT
jgi:hypothetical protein